MITGGEYGGTKELLVLGRNDQGRDGNARHGTAHQAAGAEQQERDGGENAEGKAQHLSDHLLAVPATEEPDRTGSSETHLRGSFADWRFSGV